MRVDKTNWQRILVSECTKVVKGKTAIQKKEYRDTGLYPIISQEKDFISGYCDNSENLNSIGEVIIFGDHTRVLKYIDFDFCIGADGVKILQPYSFLNAKYLYHFLRWIDIPSNGYSRHFKFLKETIVKYPPLAEQKGIAAELDAIQVMIEGYREQLVDLDALAQSIFLDTFGDPISNPKGWKKDQLGNLIVIKHGKDHKAVNDENGKYPIYGSGGKMGMAKEYLCEPGTTIIGRKGTINSPILVNERFWNIDTAFGLFPKDLSVLTTIYLYYFCLTTDFTEIQSGAAIPSLTQKDISNLRIPVPPLLLQQQFAERVEAIERQKELLRQQIADAETLMAERMQYYFS